MFGKKKVRDQEPPFKKNAEFPVPAEDDKREIEDKNKSEINMQTADMILVAVFQICHMGQIRLMKE